MSLVVLQLTLISHMVIQIIDILHTKWSDRGVFHSWGNVDGILARVTEYVQIINVHQLLLVQILHNLRPFMPVLINFTHNLFCILTLLLIWLLVLALGGIVALRPLRRNLSTSGVWFSMFISEHISGEFAYLLVFVLILQRVFLDHKIILKWLQNLLLIATSCFR